LLTGNTMAQAVRERIPELAVLKTIGFSRRSVLALVLAEAVLLLAIGASIGLLLAGVATTAVQARIGTQLVLPPVGAAEWLRGLALAAVIGILVGFLPARRGSGKRIVDALAGR
jgi:putative ABC transport system permease protein